MMNGSRPKILVLAGVRGLEAAFYLRMKLEDRADITLVSDRTTSCSSPTPSTSPSGLTPRS